MTQSNLCPNCNTPLQGKFCHNCGQKKIEDKERKLTHFIYQFFGAAFFLENNFLKNTWYLLIRPGFLASEYLQGRRKKYMAPFSLFLLINLIYFLIVPLSDLNLSLSEQLNQPMHKHLAKKLVDNRLQQRDTSFDQYAAEYNNQSTSLSKTLIVLHVPFIAAFLMLFYLKQKYFYTDHIIYSLYLVGFILLISIISYLVIINLMKLGWLNNQAFFSISGYALMIFIPLYIFFSLRKYYQQPIGWTLFKTPLVIVAFIFSHFIYRMLLFYVVFWTT